MNTPKVTKIVKRITNAANIAHRNPTIANTWDRTDLVAAFAAYVVREAYRATGRDLPVTPQDRAVERVMGELPEVAFHLHTIIGQKARLDELMGIYV